MQKATARINVPGFGKSGVSAAEAVPAASAFVDVRTSNVRMSGGKAVRTTALLPDLELFDRGRITFGIPTLGGTVTGATLRLLGVNASGVVSVLGKSVLAGGAFPDIEFDINAGDKLFVQVSELAGTAPTLSVTADIQGFNRAYTFSS